MESVCNEKTGEPTSQEFEMKWKLGVDEGLRV